MCGESYLEVRSTGGTYEVRQYSNCSRLSLRTLQVTTMIKIDRKAGMEKEEEEGQEEGGGGVE